MRDEFDTRIGLNIGLIAPIVITMGMGVHQKAYRFVGELLDLRNDGPRGARAIASVNDKDIAFIDDKRDVRPAHHFGPPCNINAIGDGVCLNLVI